MTTRRARIRSNDDQGASLVLALVFVTVVSVVVMAVLGLAETGFRSTLALRQQIAETAAAEGGAQVAINDLKGNTFTGTGNCFGANANLPLDNFYQRSGTNDSVRVECATDTSATVVPSPAGPTEAVLALARFRAGININRVGIGAKRVLTQGSIHSNSRIGLGIGLNLTAGGTGSAVTASNNLLGCPIAGTITPACVDGVAEKTALTIAAPAAAATARTLPTSCPSAGTRYRALDPGLYNNLAQLNAWTNNCNNVVIHFRPGTYYFDFSGTWNVNNGYFIGGTLPPGPPLGPGSTPAIPGACVSPLTSPGTAGVRFVFTRQAVVAFGSAAQVELCGHASGTEPPIALEGLSNTTSVPPSVVLQAIFECLDLDIGTDCNSLMTTTATVNRLYIQGMIYAPTSRVQMAINNTTQQVIRNGLIVRRWTVDTDRTTNPPPAIVEIPAISAAVPRTVVWLNVFVCQGASSCNSGGTNQLHAKVLISNPTTTRDITILSWSTL